MTFSDPRWLAGLLLLPVFALLEWWAAARRARGLKRLVGERRGHPLLEQRRRGETWIGAALKLGSLALLAIGAARPEWGREVVRRGATGSDVVMLVDVSASMDARDVPPSRLAEARREALAVLERLGGSRVGVVAFAGDAIRLCPLTLDRAAARLIIESLSSGSISAPGSDLGRALRAALRVLPGGRREEQAMVLWTDGEDLEQGARAATEEVARAGVRVFAVGVGTPIGDVVPVVDAEGHTTDVKRDEKGNLVRSRLDQDLLRLLARRTRGSYFAASRAGGELPRLVSALGSVSRAGRGERLIERPMSRFGLFGALAGLLLAVDRARARRRRASLAEAPPLHSERGAAAAAVVLALLLPARAAAQSPWARGDRAFRAGRFAEAESLYALRLKRGGPAEVRVNRATAEGLKGGAQDAQRDLEPLAGRSDLAGREAGYNLGTLLGLQRQYDSALDALRRVLERDPGDQDARWNYEVLMRKKEEERRSPDKNPPPKPSPSGGGGGANQSPANPRPAPSTGSLPAPQSAGAPPQPQSSGGGRMTRAEAGQLLDALQELSRVEQQRQRKVRVTREKQGRDW